jgi:hypothetical protein
MLTRFLALVVFFVLFAASASAQLFDSIGGTLKDADIGGTLGTTPAPATSPDTSALVYKADPAVTEQVLQQFIDGMKQLGQVTPEQMEQVETAIRQNINRDSMQQFIDELFGDSLNEGKGFQLDNLADVVSIYIIASFVVINDLQNGTTTDQDQAVRDQVAAAFSTLPEVTGLSDSEKQMAAESLLLYVMFLANDWQQAVQGAEGYDLGAVKTQARDTLIQSGIDPAQFDFTPQGLIRKGGNQTQGGTTTTTTTPATTTTAPQSTITISPAVQAQVDAMTPEQLQEMTSGCQAALQDPEAAKQAAGGGENGEIALQICQAIVNKSGGAAQQQTTQQQTTQQTQSGQTANPLEPNSGGTNPLAGGADPFVGSFNGNNISLVLQGSNNTYTGELTFNGTPFPVQATANGTNLTGTFTSGSNTFNFTATLQDKTLALVSDGNTFNLTKQ